jgi:hypothetical protein
MVSNIITGVIINKFAMNNESAPFESRDVRESRRESLKRLFREVVEQGIRDRIRARIKPYLERTESGPVIRSEADRILWEIIKGTDEERIAAEIEKASDSIVASKLPFDFFATDLIAEESLTESGDISFST